MLTLEPHKEETLYLAVKVNSKSDQKVQNSIDGIILAAAIFSPLFPVIQMMQW